jgi:hypothetical protein
VYYTTLRTRCPSLINFSGGERKSKVAQDKLVPNIMPLYLYFIFASPCTLKSEYPNIHKRTINLELE